jgi:hypothetical protein
MQNVASVVRLSPVKSYTRRAAMCEQGRYQKKTQRERARRTSLLNAINTPRTQTQMKIKPTMSNRNVDSQYATGFT